VPSITRPDDSADAAARGLALLGRSAALAAPRCGSSEWLSKVESPLVQFLRATQSDAPSRAFVGRESVHGREEMHHRRDPQKA
jgi:hypothetical protein